MTFYIKYDNFNRRNPIKNKQITTCMKKRELLSAETTDYASNNFEKHEKASIVGAYHRMKEFLAEKFGFSNDSMEANRLAGDYYVDRVDYGVSNRHDKNEVVSDAGAAVVSGVEQWALDGYDETGLQENPIARLNSSHYDITTEAIRSLSIEDESRSYAEEATQIIGRLDSKVSNESWAVDPSEVDQFMPYGFRATESESHLSDGHPPDLSEQFLQPFESNRPSTEWVFNQDIESSNQPPERESPPTKSFESRMRDSRNVGKELFKEGYSRIEVESTREVYDAVQEFYSDHTEAMATAEYLLDSVSGNVLPEEQGSDLFAEDKYGHIELHISEEYLPDSVSLRESIRQMAEGISMIQGGDTKKGASKIYNLLSEGRFAFNEVSVGVSSVGDEQINFATQFTQRMMEKVHHISGEPYPRLFDTAADKSGYLQEKIETTVNRAKEEFSQEIRPASQLEFHNSPYINEILQTGKIATRYRQELEGEARNTTSSASNHSRLIHFSETLITEQYKEGGSLGNHNEHDEEKNKRAVGGTLAVPLAEIIKKTPYARGARYGTASAKEGLVVDHKVTKSVPVHEGNSDGRYSATGTDRVFLASIDNKQAAQDYQYDTFDMRTDYGTAAFVLIDDKDAAKFNARNDTREGRTQLGHEDSSTVPDYLSKTVWGEGEGMPLVKRYKRGEDELILEGIRKRLDENPEFKNKVVFPLRGNLYIDASRGGDYSEARDGGQLPSD